MQCSQHQMNKHDKTSNIIPPLLKPAKYTDPTPATAGNTEGWLEMKAGEGRCVFTTTRLAHHPQGDQICGGSDPLIQLPSILHLGQILHKLLCLHAAQQLPSRKLTKIEDCNGRIQ